MTTIANYALRPATRLIVALTFLILVSGRGSGVPGLQAQDNPVRAENLLPGDNDWDVPGSGHSSIQGFATEMSVNVGATIDFKIDTPSTNYRVDIYRLGYYNGAGARKVATIADSSITKVSQPGCLSDPSTGLVDCGNWTTNASWAVPSTAVSGVYVARPTRQDGNAAGQASHIYFVVRDDSRVADIIMQTSDTTWQAYNMYGGNSLYCGAPYSNEPSAYACPARAVKVSYNRPIDTRAHDPQSFLFNAEYPMIRFLEANGYDVKYWSGVDTDRFGGNGAMGLTSAKKPKIFLSVGHDEYWSGLQRTAVENARNAGVNLAFMSGNEIYWKTRWEPSLPQTPGGPVVGHRTLVSYKETLNNAKIDPGDNGTIEATDPWTGTWRDTRFSPPSDGGRPENGLIGSIWTVNSGSGSIQVPASMAGLRLWRNTRVANLQGTAVATLGSGTLGYEWGEALENGFQPAGLIRMSSTTKDGVEKIIDFGSHVGFGSATHTLTLYKHQSGALVFGASTVQWSWGLDGSHDQHGQTGFSNTPDQAIQQATINLFADMGAQPASLQAGADPTNFPLQTTSGSADIAAPTSVITSPLAGAEVESGNRIILTGTATDGSGGVVGGVEVSVDGGTTWNKATGTNTWTYEWVPGLVGPANLKSRAVDDSGNIEIAGSGISVSVVVGECPCTSLWKDSVTPANTSFPDANEYELGVKFRSEVNGFITGIRFYKGASNTGTHAGSLWSETGTLLATAVFTNETASGWQKVDFSTPVAIAANTTYVASYHAPVGGYAVNQNYFASTGVNSPPLLAQPSTLTGGTGVFSPGAMAFPNNGVSHNYWVDVVFAQSLDDQDAPIISNIRSSAIDGSRVAIQWMTNEPSTTRIDYSTNPAIQTASLDTLPAGTATVASPSFVTQHGLTLTGLQSNTTYYFLVSSSDGAGNITTVAAPSFTVPGPTLRDTAATDFGAGTTSSTYVSQSADGEVILAPTVGSEFSGPAIPAGWVSANWGTGGSAEIVDGVLLVDGARVASCASPEACAAESISSTHGDNLHTGPRALEFSANYSGDQFQHAGLGQTFTSSNEPWAIFSTLSGGNLFARTNTGAAGFSMDTLIGAAPLGEFHNYRIDWKADRVDYYIDGVLVVTHALAITSPMRPVAASDINPFGGIIFVDWMRMWPGTSAGTFESRVFDANAIVNWKAIQWKANVPAGTTLQISVRTGSTPAPDGNWTAWSPIAGPGPLTLTSQFIQYRAEMSTTDPFVTPELQDVIITTGNAPVAVNDSVEIARNTTYTFPASGPGSLIANDTDADPSDTLRVVSVTPASHGLATLNANGTVSYSPTLNYFGPDSFTYTMSDGLLTASATASITVHENNVPPVANHDLYHMQEDTTLFVPGRGVLINDTDVDNNPLTAVLVSAPVQGSLTLNQGGSFSYTPPLNFAGPITFAYRTFDGEAYSQPATVAIEIAQVNDPPFTVEDNYFALLNQPLDVAAPGVLANDRDVEVEDINPLTAQLISTTSHGMLTLNANGSFSYVPDPDYLGTDSFVYAAVDHFGAVSLTPRVVTLNVALKAVSASVPGGGSVNTGGAVSPGDPLRSQVTTPTPATVAIAQGVISGTASPNGFTFLNQQVNITVTGENGLEVTASPSNPLVFTFEIDHSIAAGQTHETFQMFRNNVLVPDCLGATTIPAANLDPCISRREAGVGTIKLTVLTTHASSWNMGLSTEIVDELHAINDGPFPTNYEAPVTRVLPGVLYNDFGGEAITAHLVAGSEIGGSVLLEPSGAFEFTPAAGFCGMASFQYRVGDGDQFSVPALVTIPVNCRPIANNDAFTVLEDSGQNTFTVLSNDTDPDGVPPFTITAVSQGANGVVTFTGQPANMFVVYIPAANFYGSDSFTYTMQDSRGDSSTATVNVNVTPVNDVPSFAKGADQTVFEESTLQTVPGWATALSAGPANESGQALTFLTQSNNAALFSTQPAVSADGTLTYQPAPDANGTATVTVAVQDNGGTDNSGVDTSTSQNFTITVTGINDAPSFTKGANQTMLEDTGAQSVPNWATAISAGPANESSQAVDFLVSTDNPDLFSQLPAVSPAGTLTYDPALNANGSATVSVRIHDNGGTANGGVDTSEAQTFTINVSLLNDGPTFTPGADQTVNEDAGAQSVAWATNMSAGPADEASQALAFVVESNSNAALFSVAPAISTDGTLTYTPAPDAFGSATVSVRLTDDGGTLNGGSNSSAAHVLTITVTPVNDDPIAVADSATVAEDSVANAIDVLANDNDGPDAGETLTVTAVTQGTNGSVAFTATGVTYTPNTDYFGADSFSYTIADGNGGSATSTVDVTVTNVNDNPVAVADSVTVAEDSSANAIDVLVNDHDGPDTGETLTVTAVSQGTNGTVTFTATGVSYTPNANYFGNDSFSYTIADGNGGSATATVDVTVTNVNDNPVAVADTATVAEDSGANAIDVLANDNDGPDAGETLTVTAVTQGTNGSVAFTETGVTYTPNANYFGSDSFSYTIADGNGGSATATVNVTVTNVNDNPIATNDAATVAEDSSANAIDVLANDNDGPDAGETLTVTAVSQGTSGTVTFTATGVSYTPNANYFGNDSFTYTIGDGNGGVATATVNVTVTNVNDNPVAVTDSATVAEDSGANAITVLANDNLGPDTGETLTVTAVTQGANGTVTFTTTGVSYTPNGNYFGNDSFTYTIGDGNGGSATATVSVTVTNVNDNPIATNDAATVAEDSGANAINVLANDNLGPDTGETLTVTAVSQGTNGTVTFTATGVSYTPNGNYFGNDSFAYTIGDGNGGVATATVNVTVTSVNDNPVAVTDSATVAEDSSANAIAVLANDTLGPDVGETLTVTAVTQGAHGAVTFSAAGVSYTPQPNYFGADSFTYTIGDGNGGTATATVNVTVTNVNDNPVAITDSATVAEDSGANAINVLANDNLGPDLGETLAVTAVTQGTRGSVTFTATGVSYTPQANYFGADSFTYTIGDGNGGTATATVNVTVTNVNDNPVAVMDSATVAEDSSVNAIAVLANDTLGPDVGETLAVTAVTQGAHGAVTFSAAGVSYTPQANYFGADSFTYTIGDGNGGTATATISVTVTNVNDNPSANADNKTVAEDSGANAIDVLANDSIAPDAGETLTVTAVTQGTRGAVTFTATGVSYTPQANYFGADSFTYTIGDGNGGTATATVNVTVTNVNDNPSANADNKTVAEDSGPNAIDVLANDSIAPDAGETLTVTAVTQGTRGAVTFTATGVSYAPQANYFGSDSFTYTIGDGNGGTATATVNVTVTNVNDNPAASADNATVAEDSGANAINVLGNDSQAPDAGETLTVTAVTQGTRGAVTFTATGVSYTPQANYFGADSFTYTIGDGNGGTATATVNVTVTNVNDNPVATVDSATMAEDSGANAINVLANDTIGPDTGETLSVTAVTQGTRGAVTFTATGVSYTPQANYFGADSFTYTIGDGNGGSATATVNVTVTNVNDNPTVVADTAAVTQNSSVTGLTLLANDSAAPDTAETLTITSVTQGTNGTVAITGGGTTVSYTPATGYTGSDSFTYTVGDGNGGSATGTVSVTVNPMPSLRIENVSLTEGNSGNKAFQFPVNLSAATQSTVTVNYQTFAGTARDGRDYISASGIVTFAAGETSKTVTVQVIGETTKEKDETFSVRISGASNATIARAEAIGIILDDDTTPTATASSARTAEGNGTFTGDGGSESALTFEVRLSNLSEIPVSVQYMTLGLGATPGVDFDALSGVLAFGEDELVKTITIPVKGDKQHEKLERVRLRLHGPVEMILDTPEVDGEIIDDDPAPTVSVQDVSIVEGNAGTTNAVFTVTLSEAAGTDETVQYVTVAGTATALVDFTPVTGMLKFDPGVTSMTVTVPINGDDIIEPSETFTLSLSTVVGSDVTLARAQATGTIVNDDSSTWVSGTLADLKAGVVDAGAYIASMNDGSVTLRPRVGVEFDAAALPTGWTKSPGGTVTMTNGVAVIDGAQIQNTGGLYSYQSLEYGVTFNGPSQTVGTAQLRFTTKLDGSLWAVTLAPKAASVETPLPAGLLGSQHRYRIEWQPTGVVYMVDGVVVATHAVVYPGATAMMAVIADLGAGAVALDWVAASPYQGTGQFTSAVFDAGETVNWQNASWLADTPLGTGVTIQVRVGSTPTPDASWSAFNTVLASGGTVGGSGRYAQYRVVMTTAAPTATPAVKELAITYSK